MASELRVNSSTNRSGLGTITYTDSGPIVSGVGTFSNGLTVDGTQTTVKSLKFTGDNYNANWFKTSNKLRFNDNAKATFGTADDLSIYHDGSNNYIEDTGTGSLILKSNHLIGNAGAYSFMNAANSQTLIYGVEGGAVQLFHSGSKKFETTAQGIDVTGHSELDNVNISGVTTIGTGGGVTPHNSGWATNSRLNLYGNYGGGIAFNDNGNNGFVQYVSSSGTLFHLKNAAVGGNPKSSIKCIKDGGVELYYNNIKMLETNIPSGHNGEVILGQKVHVKHTASGNGQIFPASGNMYLNATDSKTSIMLVRDAGVHLAYNHNIKLETTNTGAVISGILTATSFSGNHIGITTFNNGDINGISFPLNVKNDNNHNDYDMGTGIKLQGGSSTEFYKWCAIVARGENNGVAGYSNSQGLAFYTYNNYGASGGTEKVRISSDGDVGIGTDSPQSAGLTVLRNSEARLQVWANGDGSNGKVALRADGNNTQIGTWSNHDCKLVRNSTIQASISSNGISFPAGKGIDFSATSDANGTMASELFADYERGTHNISVTSSSTNPTVNISSNHSKLFYTKIGDMVHVTGELRWTISSHGSGHLRISLPFTSDNTTSSNSQGTAQTWNVNWRYGRSDAEYLLSEVLPGANYMIFRVACNDSLNEPYLSCGSNYQKTANSGYGVEYQVSIWYRTA